MEEENIHIKLKIYCNISVKSYYIVVVVDPQFMANQVFHQNVVEMIYGNLIRDQKVKSSVQKGQHITFGFLLFIAFREDLEQMQVFRDRKSGVSRNSGPMVALFKT